MLGKANRIKKKKDFEKIFKNSKSFKNDLFILKISKNNLGLNRAGFVVSTKISKKATERNKARRRLTELMRNEIGKIKVGTDLVFIARPGIEKKSFSELKKAVAGSLVKSRVIIGS